MLVCTSSRGLVGSIRRIPIFNFILMRIRIKTNLIREYTVVVYPKHFLALRKNIILMLLITKNNSEHKRIIYSIYLLNFKLCLKIDTYDPELF